MLATLVELKSYLGITDDSQDTLLTIFLESADSYIKQYTWRALESATFVEYINGNAQLEMIVKQYPITSVTTIERNVWDLATPVREVVENTVYEPDGNVWRIFFRSPLRRGFQNYKVTYVAWYATIPSDLKLACLKLAWSYMNTRGTDWIKSETVNWDKLDYDTKMIPNDILSILGMYRDV